MRQGDYEKRRLSKGPGRLRLNKKQWAVATFAFLYKQVLNDAFALKFGDGMGGSFDHRRNTLREAGKRCREAWNELSRMGVAG